MISAILVRLRSNTRRIGRVFRRPLSLFLLVLWAATVTVLGAKSGLLDSLTGQIAGLLMLGIGGALTYTLMLILELVRAAARSQKRLRSRLRTIDNTAGSVGRLAPLVREMHSSLVPTAGLHGAPGDHTTNGHSRLARSGSASVEPTRLSFPVPDLTPTRVRRSQIRAAVILDEFSTGAFASEWAQIRVTPESWRDVLAERPDLLFVESAWAGNDKAWLYHLVGETAPRPALVEMIDAFREAGVPTVFWNKEDPPHFEDFLPTASLFDVVFTTEKALVPEYRSRLGHDRIHVLPFAAQPAMHNPARIGKQRRDLDVAFGGMYFRHKFPERREQMDFLLPAAARFSFDIFSRHADGSDPNYLFPNEYQKDVRGSLPYPEMLSAYHAYKVTLNVNSVPQSESMCARRIFEATACGSAVVSPPTAAIDEYFTPGTITQVATEEAAYHEMRALLRSPEFRDRRVHLAQRDIWRRHTYGHRVDTILEHAGVASEPSRMPSLSIVLPTIRPWLVDRALETVARFEAVSPQLVLLAHGFDVDGPELRARARDLGISDLQILTRGRDHSLGTCLNALVENADGEIVTKMDDDDHYGTWYLHDLVTAHAVSGADVVGKAATYVFVESRDATILTYGGHEHRFTDFVRGGTILATREVMLETPFADLGVSEDSTFLKDIIAKGGRVYGADRFNYVLHRGQPSAHTWRPDDAALFGSGEMRYAGNGIAQVSL